MHKRSLINLLTYDAWAMNKVIGLAQPVADDLPQKFHDIISHIFNAQTIWYSRMKGKETNSGVWEKHHPESWQIIHQNNTANLQELLRSLDDDELLSAYDYINSRGQAHTNSYSDTFIHISLHGQYHRGQLVQLMKGIVDPLPATDYVFYKR